ncbi:replication initiation protein, partial [Comamonas testosteroni]|uniref:replication initiation protein n=1 Tax=Comamonas testosteroni TaxID=285 RepID=UPI003B3BAD00
MRRPLEEAFRAKLEADSGYAGLMTKNPAHPLWRVLRGPRLAYELGELAEWVDLPKHLPKRKPEEIGLGRNVTVFGGSSRNGTNRTLRHSSPKPVPCRRGEARFALQRRNQRTRN